MLVNDFQPVGSLVYTFDLTDPEDLVPLYHFILGGNDNNGQPAFVMDNSTGQMRTASWLSYQTGPTSYLLRLRAIDTPRQLFYASVTDVNLTVIIVDTNKAPYLVSQPGFSFPENTKPNNYSTIGTLVYTVVAGDANVGQNHTYSFMGGNTNNAFVVSVVPVASVALA